MQKYPHGAYLLQQKTIAAQLPELSPQQQEAARKSTISYGILQEHNQEHDPDSNRLRIRFDAMASHDITYVGIIQTARASGMQSFPIPYVLTNCHNSLCAVGGTINEDDHRFGLSAAKKYGGIYVPAHQAVIHQYMRECMAGCGKMILGSDSHTRYGAIGTMAIGEGGPELVKQLLGDTYDIAMPPVVGIYLTGAPQPGVGPQDVALALIKEVFADGYVKNCILEFVGPGIQNLSMDFRCGIDVMTTETTCLSSIWVTDAATRDYLECHGRAEEYRTLAPGDCVWYDKLLAIDLSQIRPMIALPFHPSNAFEIDELIENAPDILRQTEQTVQEQFPGLSLNLTGRIRDKEIWVEQGVIAGCAGGGYENICEAAHILENKTIGCGEFSLSIYPASQPIYLELMKNGTAAQLMQTGATLRTAFCGPCFGAGDVPANGGLSIRHSTRNFPNREGSKPAQRQLAGVALMDARSIAATAANGGRLCSAQRLLDAPFCGPAYHFDGSLYQSRCYHGAGHPKPEEPLVFGPNIADWPQQPTLGTHAVLRVCSVILDEVTTTDELIPSGETSSYRSNPLRLAQFTLSRKDPHYVQRAKESASIPDASLLPEWEQISQLLGTDPSQIEVGSLVYARRPGDGSAREQAASCQRVLGGLGNLCLEYATKRYRSNLINWGMLPLRWEAEQPIAVGDLLVLPHIRDAVQSGASSLEGYLLHEGTASPVSLTLDTLTPVERQILLDGCLINFNRSRQK